MQNFQLIGVSHAEVVNLKISFSVIALYCVLQIISYQHDLSRYFGMRKRSSNLKPHIRIRDFRFDDKFHGKSKWTSKKIAQQILGNYMIDCSSNSFSLPQLKNNKTSLDISNIYWLYEQCQSYCNKYYSNKNGEIYCRNFFHYHKSLKTSWLVFNINDPFKLTSQKCIHPWTNSNVPSAKNICHVHLRHLHRSYYNIHFGYNMSNHLHFNSHGTKNFLILQHPLDHVLSIYLICLVVPTHQFCLDTKINTHNKSFIDILKSKSNILLHSLLDYYCECFQSNQVGGENCSYKKKEKAAHFVIQNLQKVFTVIGLMDNLDESMNMIEYALSRNISRCDDPKHRLLNSKFEISEQFNEIIYSKFAIGSAFRTLLKAFPNDIKFEMIKHDKRKVSAPPCISYLVKFLGNNFYNFQSLYLKIRESLLSNKDVKHFLQFDFKIYDKARLLHLKQRTVLQSLKHHYKSMHNFHR